VLPDLSIEPDDIVITPTAGADNIWDAPFEITAEVHNDGSVPEDVEEVEVLLRRVRDGVELDRLLKQSLVLLTTAAFRLPFHGILIRLTRLLRRSIPF